MIQTILALILLFIVYMAIVSSPKAIRFFKKFYIEQIKTQEYLEDIDRDKIPDWNDLTKKN